MTGTIPFDEARRERLRDAYKAAVAQQLEQFTFEGQEYVTGYAKYLLEYLDMHFQNKRNKAS